MTCNMNEELTELRKQRDMLFKALVDADSVITQLMPGVKHIALQDYGFLNDTLMNTTAAINYVKEHGHG